MTQSPYNLTSHIQYLILLKNEKTDAMKLKIHIALNFYDELSQA